MTIRTTWSPVHKGSLVTLTNGNRDMVLADQQQTARITVGRDAALGGVVCFELPRLADGSFVNVPSIGLGLETQPYDGSGITGYHPGSFYDGWSITDSALSAVFGHSGAFLSDPPTIMGGVAAFVVALGGVHDIAAGTLKVYAIRSVGNGNPVLCHTITGLPTSGVFYPTLGWGNYGVTTEAYRWNGGQDAVTPHDGPDWRPGGSLMWDESFPPVSAFTQDVTIGVGPLEVAFTDTSTNDPASWLWDFGDGETSTAQNPTHTYADPGRYTVTLTATNPGGSSAITVTYAVTVTTPPATFPCIAFDNLLARPDVTLSASSEAAGFEAANAADWKPYTWWKPTAAGDAWIDLDFDHTEVSNCLAIYAHDLGTNGAWVQLRHSLDAGATWLNATVPIAPAGTEAIYLRYLPLPAAKLRLFVHSPSVASRIGVLFIGPDFESERGCRVGFGPPALNRATSIINTQSQNGIFLGRSVIYQGVTVSLAFDFLSEDFLRETWLPFMIHAEVYPWFLLWDESEHADEACWCFSQTISGSAFTKRTLLNAGIKAMGRIE